MQALGEALGEAGEEKRRIVQAGPGGKFTGRLGARVGIPMGIPMPDIRQSDLHGLDAPYNRPLQPGTLPVVVFLKKKRGMPDADADCRCLTTHYSLR